VGETSPPSSSSGTCEGRLVVVAKPNPALEGGGEVVLLSWACRLKRPNMLLFGIAAGTRQASAPPKDLERVPELKWWHKHGREQGWQGQQTRQGCYQTTARLHEYRDL
jgi:hypothetical protein